MLDGVGEDKYGSKIVATLSHQLTEQFGKVYIRAGIFRMVKVARAFPEAEIVATLSRQLTWSRFIELAEVSDPTKRDMKILQDLGPVEHVGPSNGGYWKRLK